MMGVHYAVPLSPQPEPEPYNPNPDPSPNPNRNPNPNQVLLWVFSGQAQWLLFMTLCRGFMTGAQQPPRPSAPDPLLWALCSGPSALPRPSPSARTRGARSRSRSSEYTHAAGCESRPHLAHVSPASRPHDGRHRRLRDALRRGHPRRRRPRHDPDRADRPHLAQHHGRPRDERALLTGYIEPQSHPHPDHGPGPGP